MSVLRFEHLCKVYGDGTRAVEDFHLDVADGELMVLVGPSGCGKSTLLRMVAGLESIDGGELFVDEQRVNGLPPQQRDVAMVFQNYALYPHMSVRANLEFPLKLRRLPRRERTERVQKVASQLGLAPLLPRKPAQLSGGQRQRVAMGRALVRDPKVFLMDEPLSNLDAKLRLQVRNEISALQRRLGTTTLYVTHDQAEAMSLGQRVVVMRGGGIEQVGTPQALYDRPATAFVAGFLGQPGMNLWRCPLVTEQGPACVLGGRPIALSDPQGELAGKREVWLGLRPEALKIAPPGVPAILEAPVETVEEQGHEVLVHLGGELGTLGTERERHSAALRLPHGIHPAPGRLLPLVFSSEAAHLFDVETGRRLLGVTPNE